MPFFATLGQERFLKLCSDKVLRSQVVSKIVFRRPLSVGVVKCANFKKTNDEQVINKQKLNPGMEKKRQMVLMEMEVYRQSDNFDLNVNELRVRDWKEIMELGSPNQRKKYYNYLMKRKMDAEGDKKRKERKNAERIAREDEIAIETAGHIQYGLGKNTLYFRVHDQSITKFNNSKLAHAALFGQKLVFDLGYNSHMRPKDVRSCVDQLRTSYGNNRQDDDPFHLHLCNARPDETLLAQLKLAVPPLAQPKPLVTVTEKSYLDIFPKKKLVYLTPDCQNDLVEYDHDAVYIIGCFVDMMQSLPLSLAKAKAEGLKMARLPLERYVDFSRGANKSLTLDQMMNILLTIKNTGDWDTALKFVPRRKKTQRNYIQRGPFRQRGESLFGHLS